MRSISSSQMREWEHASAKVGILPSVLMENAGRESARFISDNFPEVCSILIVCGKGNNAGDGFVTARYLSQQNKKIEILLLASPQELKADAKVNFEKCRLLSIPVKNAVAAMRDYDLVVDALLGTGITREVTGSFREGIEAMNASGRPVVALDIPSGLDADSGKILGGAVRAVWTLTFGAAKHGLLREQGLVLCGSLRVIDIGLPLDLLDRGKESLQ